MSLVRSSRWREIKTLNDSNIDIKELQIFYKVRDELACYTGNILLRNNPIVIPSALRRQAIDIAHKGHQGINRTKSFIRSKIWIPQIDEQVENIIKTAYHAEHQIKMSVLTSADLFLRDNTCLLSLMNVHDTQLSRLSSLFQLRIPP